MMMKKILIGLIVFVGLTAISLLVPPSPPGELSLSEMARRDRSPCQTCPPTEQVVAAGMLAGDEGWDVNVRFAAPPFKTRVRLTLNGVPQPIDLEQTGSAWHVAGGSGAVTGVAQSGAQVVFTLPTSLRATGVSVSTASGDRWPDSGWIDPQYAPAPGFNATDVVLLAVLAIAAWFGARRGVVAEVGNLVAVIISVAVAAVIYRPVAAWFAGWTQSARMGAAIGSGALVVIVGVACLAAVPATLRWFRPAAADMDPRVNRGLGAVVAALRQLMVLAMIVTVGVDAAVFHWASRSIAGSWLGGSLLHAWRAVFAA